VNSPKFGPEFQFNSNESIGKVSTILRLKKYLKRSFFLDEMPPDYSAAVAMAPTFYPSRMCTKM